MADSIPDPFNDKSTLWAGLGWGAALLLLALGLGSCSLMSAKAYQMRAEAACAVAEKVS